MARRDDDDDDDRDFDDDDDRPRKKKKRGLKDEEKQMGMFCHIGALIGGFIIPLVIWMMKKDESRFVDRHGKEALNFNISLLIYYLVGVPLTCGFIVLILAPFTIYWCIMAGMAANKGQYYSYPMTIRFIK
jgi:uncharacterized Tic20 family protein